MRAVRAARTLRRAPALAAVGVLATVGLSGCQSLSTAATVGGQSISTHDVDLVTKALCVERSAAPKSMGSQTTPISQVQGQALTALISASLTSQFVHGQKVDRRRLDQQMAGIAPLLRRVPAEDRAETRDLVARIVGSELKLSEIGTNAAGAQASSLKPDQVYALGQRVRSRFDRKVHVTVNPRYSVSGPGSHAGGGGSLSRAVSPDAKQGQQPQSDPGWVSGLPSSLRCG